jgi:hypothetical protein
MTTSAIALATRHALLAALVGLLGPASVLPGAGEPAATLPPGVEAVWAIDRAHAEASPTRERVCLNGLWQWQPAEAKPNAVPDRGWGWFKVPGCWPGITDYMQKDCQRVYPHPDWQQQHLASVTTAWYQRQFTVPERWTGRRITLAVEYLNSIAAVLIDGTPAGLLRFPGGDLDLTPACQPGKTHTLSLLVTASPLKGVMLSYSDSAAAREVRGEVARRGLCGDVSLISTPPGPRIAEVGVSTSFRQRAITLDVGLDELDTTTSYRLRAEISGDGKIAREFDSPPFRRGEVKNGRFVFSTSWLPDRLWDTHTPGNTHTVRVFLLGTQGETLDASWPERFGFREFWIAGRDFHLNGTRIFLSSVPLDNAQISAGLATYAAARESLERLQSFGVNLVYTHNYGCEPGSHLGFTEILRAADDVGMLVAFSQPHFSHYEWAGPEADRTNGYARHAAFYVRAARNHPSVVMYSMSHNATGYNDDMNPDLIDGIHDVRDNWARRNVERALRAEAIVRDLDPSRIVYHHASGNLGPMHVINFYPNFAPIQELSDWFEHWATTGVKPVFLCEYGAPFTWDWTMYRGWFDGKREFGSAAVPWEFCLAEWNAQFLGDRAYRISEPERANLRWEAQQFRAGKRWHRWDYPFEVGSTRFEERYPVFAAYLTDNWRAFRTWGVSANSPWEHGHFWKLRDGVDRRRRDLPVDWANLQRPGFSPDYIDQRYERMDLAFERTDWIATPAAQALIRNNRPLLAFIAGKPARFTSKDHIFLPGEPVEKQLILLNNSRAPTGCDCAWTLRLPEPIRGQQRVTIAPGDQQRMPLRFELPAKLAPGRYSIDAEFGFATGERQTDAFAIDVLSAKQSTPASNAATNTPFQGPATSAGVRVALFDLGNETAAWFDRLGIAYRRIAAGTPVTPNEILVIGKLALTPDGPCPDLSRLPEGLKVIVFEQSAQVLEQRLGFRILEHGLRQVFPRVTDHPVLAGLGAESLRDWRGEATLIPPRLKVESNPRLNGAPTVTWCGLSVTRLWRCGNQGNVASVSIEKPARGDFLPILDGGYALQYSPLLAYRDGRGLAVFCQLDVTGRTEVEPVAEILTRNLLAFVSTWTAPPQRSAVYVGEPAGKAHLVSLGISLAAGNIASLTPAQVLVVGPGGARTIAGQGPLPTDWIKSGGRVLALGLNQDDVRACLPIPLVTTQAEHIAASFESPSFASPLTGVGPSDVHNRDPRTLPLVTAGAQTLGNGVLATADAPTAVFCQILPWSFDAENPANQRRTHRRVSCLVSRLLANLGVSSSTPLLDRFARPVHPTQPERRWLAGFYLDTPEEWDDPYRFFRW